LIREVGWHSAFLLSSAGSGITGETIYVDCGYNIMGFEKQSRFTVHDQKKLFKHFCHCGPAGSGKAASRPVAQNSGSYLDQRRGIVPVRFDALQNGGFALSSDRS